MVLAKGRTVMASSVLPGIAPALVRDNGEVWLATQVAHQSSDPSRDFAEALRLGLEAQPGDSVDDELAARARAAAPGRARPAADFEVTVLEGYDYWFEDAEDSDGTIAATWRTSTPRSIRRAGSARSMRRTGRRSAPRSTCAG